MGVYIYRLTTPKQQFDATINGESVKVGTMRYLFKPYWSGFDAEEINDKFKGRALNAIEKAWDDTKTPRPQYVVINKPRVGDEVYRAPKDIDLVYDDTFFVTKNRVGYLVKRDGKWAVEPNANLAGVDTMFVTRKAKNGSTGVFMNQQIPVRYKGTDRRYERGAILLQGCLKDGGYLVHIYDDLSGEYMTGCFNSRNDFEVITDQKVVHREIDGKVRPTLEAL